MCLLPRNIEKVKVPPIKCQGIKTKLIGFIAANISWDGKGKWIEPFLGSGVVAFNIQPERALLTDTNKHIINFYNDLKNGVIDEHTVREFLEDNGIKLFNEGKEYYYKVRDVFNKNGGSLPFIFLNRSSFNGLMRFNSSGGFNVPFGHKPERFRKAYITKICNQIKSIKKIITKTDWEFRVANFNETMGELEAPDFVYLDPPYIGRNTDYFNSWSEEDANRLAKTAQNADGGFALSMWFKNKYRENTHLQKHWNGNIIRTLNHFYHVGPSEDLRNEMIEALVIKPGYESKNPPNIEKRMKLDQQLSFSFD